MSEDPIRDGLNWYTYCGNNPIVFIDPFGLERIAVSGGRYSDPEYKSGYRYNFIETAIRQISDWRAAEIEATGGGEANWGNIAWIIADEGWTDDEWGYFQSIADDLYVDIVRVKSADELVNYLNTKDINNSRNLSGARLDDKITDFAVFSHGFGNMVTLGYDYSPNYNVTLNLETSHISKLHSLAFSSPNSDFYSCNTATDGATSFAAIWQRQVGGRTMAFAGTSDYHNIMYPKGYSKFNPLYWTDKGLIDSARRKYGFSAGGSFYYPSASSGVNVIIYE